MKSIITAIVLTLGLFNVSHANDLVTEPERITVIGRRTLSSAVWIQFSSGPYSVGGGFSTVAYTRNAAAFNDGRRIGNDACNFLGDYQTAVEYGFRQCSDRYRDPQSAGDCRAGVIQGIEDARQTSRVQDENGNIIDRCPNLTS